LLVTGAAGFIGSTYVRVVLDARPDDDMVVLDKLTYAGRRENLAGVEDRIAFVEGAIEDPVAVREAMEGADAVVNFAAESHVDRSIDDQDAFARTHVIGTGTLLDAARELGVERYLQVSTDEVYGSIEEGSFTETSPLNPSSPYSATKAAGDLLVSAHAHTYGTQALICRGSNNYGPRQYPEKLIPLCVLNALAGDHLPVYGDGRQVRNWLFAEDFSRAIDTVLLKGAPGEAYNVGGPDEEQNIDVVGPDGAGKTTLISAVCNLIRVTSGEVRVFGEPADSTCARSWVGLAEQDINLDRFLTVEETLVYHGGYFGMSKTLAEARASEMIDAFDLRAKADVRAPKLSGGMRRRLLLARALMHRPRLVILDEPTAGVDFELRHELWRYIRQLHSEGTTILLTTHYLEEAEELCEEIALIKGGRLIARDSAGGLGEH